MTRHVPVMTGETTRILLGTGGATFIDCTAGGGGHIDALLQAAEKPLRILALDIDSDAIELLKKRFESHEEVIIVKGDYEDMGRVAQNSGFEEADGVLADLGQSNDQLLDVFRGFSFRSDGPLDLRYDINSGISAAEFINSASPQQLYDTFHRIGEERQSSKITNAVISARPFHTSGEFVTSIRSVIGGNYVEKTLARVFMALRVVVNDELRKIECLLEAGFKVLRPGGIFVVIAYDSHQDRLVKNFFHVASSPCICPPAFPTCICGKRPQIHLVTRRALRPSVAEQALNRNCRSARLRAAEKL